MKKITLVLFAVVMTVLFTACGGEKKANDSSSDAKTEEVAKDEPKAASGSAEDQFLADYEKLIDKLIPLVEKVSKGDTSAMTEYGTISQEATNIATKAADHVGNFNEEQMKKYEEINKKYTDALQSMAK